jgi:hypothetical protein
VSSSSNSRKNGSSGNRISNSSSIPIVLPSLVVIGTAAVVLVQVSVAAVIVAKVSALVVTAALVVALIATAIVAVLVILVVAAVV